MSERSRIAGVWRALSESPLGARRARREMLSVAMGTSVFDSMASTAQRLLGADGAAVVLRADGRLLVIGSSGLDRSPAAHPTALLSETLVGASPLAVHDTEEASVPAGAIRSFLGAPFDLRDSARGALAVMSSEPRAWTDEDLGLLADLAQWPEAELARIDASARLEVAQTALDSAERVFNAMAEGVVGLDSDGTVALVNASASRMLGWEPSELIGRELHALAHFQREDGSAYPHTQCAVLSTLADGAARTARRETFWRRDGSPLHVDLSVGALVDADGANAAILVFDDVSERLDLERVKDDFVSMVSHELRTPLAAVHGSLELLEDLGDDPDAGAQMLGVAQRNTVRLMGLVDDILDLERAATGRLQIDRTGLTVQDAMAEAAEAVSGLAAAGDVVVRVLPTQARCWGDRRRIVQVLTNLASNAVRFSEQGATVTISAHGDDAGLRIDVVDTGAGIADSAQAHVFDRFWQAPGSAPRGKRGSGLGLAIAQSMARAHGGSITVRSALGEGSTFSLNLPVRAGQSAVPVDRRAQGVEA
ncbi:ATP-binding protein [Demequina salsinemoris]|uniref:ATP-binding protein n=1 Tax=Demequina salsinemoris TaxID=577470 RepID=UPI000781356B|nr:ATP-binding protein [Demequina salsinemoris]